MNGVISRRPPRRVIESNPGGVRKLLKKKPDYPKKLRDMMPNANGIISATKKFFLSNSDYKLEVNYSNKNVKQKNVKNTKTAFELDDGVYTYVIYKTNNRISVKYCRVKLLEIGTKHFHICSTLPSGSKVMIAGELKKDGFEITYNYESGTYSRNILRVVKRSDLEQLSDYVQDVFRGVHNASKLSSASIILQNMISGKTITRTREILIDQKDMRKVISSLSKEELKKVKLFHKNNAMDKRYLSMLVLGMKAGQKINVTLNLISKARKIVNLDHGEEPHVAARSHTWAGMSHTSRLSALAFKKPNYNLGGWEPLH
jgi:hypothetical protein